MLSGISPQKYTGGEGFKEGSNLDEEAMKTEGFDNRFAMPKLGLEALSLGLIPSDST